MQHPLWAARRAPQSHAAQGHIGEVIVNPYKIAPLTAIVRTGGYVVKNASVRVVPKKGGREIAYKVSDRQIRTHAGIPIAGLYADYLNTVEVSYTRVSADGKSEDFTDRLQFYAPPVFSISNGMPGQQRMFNVEVNKVDPGFEDRLYLVNSQLIPMAPQGARFVWNNPRAVRLNGRSILRSALSIRPVMCAGTCSTTSSMISPTHGHQAS